MLLAIEDNDYVLFTNIPLNTNKISTQTNKQTNNACYNFVILKK